MQGKEKVQHARGKMYVNDRWRKGIQQDVRRITVTNKTIMDKSNTI